MPAILSSPGENGEGPTIRGQVRINQLVDVLTAKSASKEFWIDPSENAHLAPLGAWGSDPNPVNYPNALNVGRDQIVNDFRKDIEHLRNQVRYIGGLYKPGNRDYWTEGVATTDWVLSTNGTGGTVGPVAYDTTSGNFKVGTKAIKGPWSGQSPGATSVTIGYNSASNLALNMNKLGGKFTAPRLVFFAKSDKTTWHMQLIARTSSGNEFVSNDVVPNGIGDTDWHLIQYPLGPYADRWFVNAGSPDWTNINQLLMQFQFSSAQASGNVWLDGVYIVGQIGIIQKDSTRISQYGLRETSIFDNTVREEDAHKDLALAELKRLRNPVMRGTVRVPGIPDILAGQKVTLTAPSAGLSVAVLRALEVRHDFSKAGFTTELDLTDDLTNYQTLEPIRLANLLLDQAAPNFRKKEEHDVAMGELDPTITFTTIDNPS